MSNRLDRLGQYEFDVIPPLKPVTITLDISPTELEMAVATNGASLLEAAMRAIVTAMVTDTAHVRARKAVR